jgi:dipeptide/tripeptide permease
MFYFCINVGSLFSTILTPIIRTYVSYAVAFGVPAVLLALATVIFWLGRNTYVKVPPAGSVLTESMRILYTSFVGRIRYWSDDTRGFYDFGMVLHT